MGTSASIRTITRRTCSFTAAGLLSAVRSRFPPSFPSRGGWWIGCGISWAGWLKYMFTYSSIRCSTATAAVLLYLNVLSYYTTGLYPAPPRALSCCCTSSSTRSTSENMMHFEVLRTIYMMTSAVVCVVMGKNYEPKTKNEELAAWNLKLWTLFYF